MKTIIKQKLEVFLNKASQDSGLKLLDVVSSNLLDVQKRIMVKRVLLFSLLGLYILLFSKLLKVKGIPGYIGDLDPLLMPISLNNVFVYALPVIYVINHYLMIHSFLYRSQMRLIRKKIYKKYFPEIEEYKLDLFVQPYSPGMQIKNFHYLEETESKEEEIKDGVLRVLVKNSEALFTWLVIPIMLVLNLYTVVSTYKTEVVGWKLELFVFLVTTFLTMIVLFFGTYKLLTLYHPSKAKPLSEVEK